MDKEWLEALKSLLDDRDGRLSKMMDVRDERLSKMMDEKLDPIKADISEIKEDAKITRTSVNTLLDWAEDAQIEVKIPLYKKAQ